MVEVGDEVVEEAVGDGVVADDRSVGAVPDGTIAIGPVVTTAAGSVAVSIAEPVVPTIVMPHVVFPVREFVLLRDDCRRLSREAVAGNLFGFAGVVNTVFATIFNINMYEVC